ncbi:MAG: Hint domain-containing protein [Pseudoruegeria sp.]
METGFRGTFVLSWSQTEVDGQKSAATDTLMVGASWRWSGEAVRVDGPSNILLLGSSGGASSDRKRAAQTVRKLVGAAVDGAEVFEPIGHDEPLAHNGFILTDGSRTYTASLIETKSTPRPLIMFLDELPPQGVELWVVHRLYDEQNSNSRTEVPQGVICFTAGTRIQTQRGSVLVQDLTVGDRLQTKDDSYQPVQWIGSRRISGARLYAMPQYRPIRIRGGALGEDKPDGDLLVSPDHRLLLKGPKAQVLFNTDEVLVAARDLINNASIHRDFHTREVTYYHLMMERHQIVWANGVETESFHPANAPLNAIEGEQRDRLLAMLPELETDPHAYGEYARRNLPKSDAAILLHEVA